MALSAENDMGYLSPDDCEECGAYATWCAKSGPCCPDCDHDPASPTPPGPTPHDHGEYVEGCFRCDLSRDETRVIPPATSDGEQS